MTELMPKNSKYSTNIIYSHNEFTDEIVQRLRRVPLDILDKLDIFLYIHNSNFTQAPISARWEILQSLVIDSFKKYEIIKFFKK